MAGSSMTFTYDDGYNGDGKQAGIRRVICTWTSDDSTGAVSGTTRNIVGSLIKAITDPGDAAPTDNYDIAITDDYSVDVLTGSQSTLANRHTSTTQQVYFMLLDAAGTPLAQSLHPVVCSPLTVSITNAGNSKNGVLVLFYRAF